MQIMSLNDFIIELQKLNINLTDLQITQLKDYCDFLLEYNKHTNLTAIKDINGVYLKHFYDSLTITKINDLTSITSLLDIGTGAGFPGFILEIVYPNLDVTLLDSNNKKITFLKVLSANLNIKVTLIQSRAEEYILNHRESFDLVVSRAVSSLNILTEISLPFVKVNGYFIAMKGHGDEELKASLNAISECGGKLVATKEFLLPIENDERTLLKIEKIKATNNKYPRIYDKIIKKPL